ncbi:penicillin amidase [Ameyamaea chiangmaiensis NBRC 103196]|uniref:Acylase n=1 Tax=Ameyamaea chiangmaiensis TaxID=442969 RepID=A0A850PCR1_9PROT|nr:acylase [Ameyamaea chiangmaiensis]MBS4075972.1 acylase [Ameyamaea chiangmaiensis]NVN39742.1 acylase [Ameyamaea chiangmaiensis]GBQ61573.1 penicillin amidase [Ameyamaea chiangmaiensis NBRC 103196]
MTGQFRRLRRAAYAASVAVSALCGVAHAAPASHGEILWDTFGVPHIYGKDEASIFYGFGWAQTHSHANILLKLYGIARGRAAEYWGPSQEESDRWLIANRVYERAGVWYKQQTPQFRADLDAFAHGINDYAAKHPNEIDPSVRMVLPISGIDVVAHAERLMNFIYIASEQHALGGPPSHAAGGSNAWAIAPSRTTDGHTVLLANPHLPWAPGFFTYYEAHMNGPGINLYGATQVGLPVLRFGFNNDLGFTNTVNTILGAVHFRLTPDGDGYRLDGKRHAFDKTTYHYKVRQADGTLADKSFVQEYAVQGPVFTRADGVKVAVYVAGLDRPGMMKQYWDMGTSHDFAHFQSAVKTLQVPMFNIVYADRAGHVMYLDNGIVPKHDSGDFAYWSGDIPGDTSATIPHGILPYEDLPKVIDPASGFVQNTNDPPWVATYPRVLYPDAYPAYLAVRGPMSFRSQQSVSMLAGTDKFSYDQIVEKKLNTHALLADRILPDLLRAARDDHRPEVRQAVAVLSAWDHADNADSRGALLFETWASLFAGPKFADFGKFGHAWSLDQPIETPYGLKDPKAAVDLLAEAAVKTKQIYGAIDRPFGEVSRFHLGNVDLPGNGGFGNTGIFRTITWSPMKNGERTPLHGETWVSLVSFSTPLRAKGLLSYGNSTQPGSPHRSDQLSFLSDKTLRDLWFARSDVEKHVESTDTY